MKAAVFAVSLLLADLTATPAAESARTAYSALRVVGKQVGADSLNHVVEVRGRMGAPEPDVWKVTLDDPMARGGLRELEVQRGKVISEKTPTTRSVGGKINFNQLNLDSEGVFSVVNQQAQKAAVPFDRVDYTLRSGAGKGSPVWHIDLLQTSVHVGEFDVAADSGNVLRSDFTKKAPKGPVIDDHAYVQTPPPPARVAPRTYPPETRRYPDDPRTYPDDRRVYPDDRRTYADDRRVYPDDRRVYADDVDDDGADGPPFPDRVGRHFEKRGRQFMNFFNGRGWTDR